MAPIRINWKINEISLGNVLTMAVLLGGVAAAYGTLTNRVSAIEDFRAYQLAANDRQTSAQQAMATEWRNLAIELKETRTILNERTRAAEVRQQSDASSNRAEIRRAESLQRTESSANRAAIQRNAAAIETKAEKVEKKPKSLWTVIGVK